MSGMVDTFHSKWREVHIKALKVHNQNQYDEFGEWVRDFAENFPCEKCERHLLEYIDSHPPEESIHPFIWTWELHNDVNERLEKDHISYSNAVKLWADYL